MLLRTIEDTKKLSKKISQILGKKDIIFLYGEIGVGKTTFVRFLINQLEAENNIRKSDVLSPTFNIVSDYEIKKVKILHYDLYRLKSYNDILELGIFETSDNYIKVIEWPELINPKPKDRIDIMFEYLEADDSRNVEIIGIGKWKDYKFNAI
tara:strand:+ start:299 stop:754 length:456 start_codon:yes stop_codon:yes gene_type:complete